MMLTSPQLSMEDVRLIQYPAKGLTPESTIRRLHIELNTEAP